MSKKKLFIAGLVVIVLVSVTLLILLRAKNKPVAQANDELTEIEDIQPSSTAVEVTPEIISTPEAIVITPSPEVIEESPKAIIDTPNPWPTKKPASKIVEIDSAKDHAYGGELSEFQYALRDTYKSNIPINTLEIDEMNFSAREWFHPTPINDGAGKVNFRYICYAIETYYKTYYDSEVLCDYYYDAYDDVVKYDPAVSTMLAEYVVHGERPLHICIDFYNYRINVQEIDDAEIERLKSLNLNKWKQ